MTRLVPWVKNLLYFITIGAIIVTAMYFYLAEMSEKRIHVEKIHWRPSTPDAERLDPVRLQHALDYLETRLPTARSLLVLRNGKTVVEKYFRKGGPAQREYLHSLNIPILQLLYGIALHRNLVVPPETPLRELFPEYFAGYSDSRLRVNDLLESQAPLLWGKGGDAYWKLFYAADRTAESLRILHTENARAAGAVNYASGFLLAKIIETGTGEPLPAFAGEHLFKPLGFDHVKREMIGVNHPDLLTGFQLKALDLLKIGVLLLQQGVWEGARLIDAEWIRERVFDATRFSGKEPGGHWQKMDLAGAQGFVARGEGGQYLALVPAKSLVIVTTSDNRFPLPKDNGREVLLEMIVRTALDRFDPEKPKADSEGQVSEYYHGPNYLFTVPVPESIVAFFDDFAKDIASGDLLRVSSRYARAYRKTEERLFYEQDKKLSAVGVWRKMYAGGSGRLQSIRVDRIRLEKNRAYLRGVSKHDYMNMNEGSTGYFPLENLIRLKGEWKWIGTTASTRLLDRDEYFDAELPAPIREFVAACSPVLAGEKPPAGRDCFARNFRVEGLSRTDFLARMRLYFEEPSDAELHITAIDQKEAGYRVSGFIANSRIGELVLPQGLEIRRSNGSWIWQVEK